PLLPVELHRSHEAARKLHHQDLDQKDEHHDGGEEPAAGDSREGVQLVRPEPPVHILFAGEFPFRDRDNVVAGPQQRQQRRHLVRGLRRDEYEHVFVDQFLGPAVRGLDQDVRVRLFAGEGKRAECVHDKVHPKQLYRRKWRLADRHRTNERDAYRDEVDRQLELQELSYAQDDVACVHGNLGTRYAHRKPNVRLFQGRSVVGSVPGHGDDFAHTAQSVHQDELVVRGTPRQNLQAGNDVCALPGGHGPEDRSLQGRAELVEDAALPGDLGSRQDVVARDHPHDNPRPLAPRDGIGDFGAHGVLDAHQADKRQVEIHVLVRFVLVHVLVRRDDRPQALGGPVFDRLVYPLRVFLGEGPDLQGIGGDDDALAQRENDLRCALDVQPVLRRPLRGAGDGADGRRHALAPGVESDRRRRDGFDRVPRPLVLYPELFREEQQRPLGRAADEDGLPGDVFQEARAVQADALAEQVAHARGERVARELRVDVSARPFSGEMKIPGQDLDHRHSIFGKRPRLVCRKNVTPWR
ncbi:MAG: hypothetical protein BJ554DRAFT_808, partial [Olpidium bornovanus]